MSSRPALPGFVNAHSHAFQRSLRGKVEGGDFWAWRESMLDVARGLTPGQVRKDYADDVPGDARGRLHGRRRVPLRRLRRGPGGRRSRAGGRRRARPPPRRLRPRRARPVPAGVRRRLPPAGGGARGRRCPCRPRPPLRPRLPPRLARGDRRATPSATASSSTSTPTSSRGRSRSALPSTGSDPSSCSPPRAASGRARRSCTPHMPTRTSSTSLPSTAPAFASAPRPRPTSATASRRSPASSSAGIPLSIGSDSNVRIDPLEELRELEGTARRQELRRNVIPVEQLLEIGSAGGARALGLDEWPGVEVDLDHPSLARRRGQTTCPRRSCTAAAPTSSGTSLSPAPSSAASPPGWR